MNTLPMYQTPYLKVVDISCCWNMSPSAQVYDFTVVADDQVDLYQWDCCRGKHNLNWMNAMDDFPEELRQFLGGESMTPTQLFGELLRLSTFKNTSEMMRAIEALSQVEECAWAREMLGQ